MAKPKPAQTTDLEKDYTFVSWDIDPTGKRLIDEICHIAAYKPDKLFRQYIMPHRDVDLLFRRRHHLKTVTIGRYRVLKEMVLGRVMKTKSELYALHDFLAWLEEVKTENSKIVLMCSEQFKLAPHLLFEGLNRYDLLQRFSESVSGFINLYPIFKDKCGQTMSSFSLKTLAKVLLDKEKEEVAHAHCRAKLCYEIVQHLSAGGGASENENLASLVLPYFTTIECEQAELDELKAQLTIQNTLRPIFYSLLKDPKERKRATSLRRYLTAANIDYATLKEYCLEGAEKLEVFMDLKVTFKNEKDAKELLRIIVSHFNKPSSEKSTSYRRRSRTDSRTEDTKITSGDTKVELPEETKVTSPNNVDSPN